jgi:hypothetical protein
MRKQTENPQNGPLFRRIPFPAAGLLLSGYNCVAWCLIQLKADHTSKCFVKLVACLSTNTLVADSSAVDRLLARRKSDKGSLAGATARPVPRLGSVDGRIV